MSINGNTAVRVPYWPLGILIFVSFVIHFPVLGLSLFSDDHSAVWKTGINGVPWRSQFLRPVPDLLLRWSCLVHGPSPTLLRMFNVALHGLNAYLVMLLLHRLTIGRMPVIAGWIAASLFLLYPYHLESIVWIVGRESALGTAFSLSALITMLSGPPTIGRTLLVMTFFSAGVLCYESALLTPLLAIPLMRASQRSRPTTMKRMILGFGAVLACYFVLRFLLLGSQTGTYFSDFLTARTASLWMNVPKVLARLFLPPHRDQAVQLFRSIFLLALLALIAFVFLRSTRNDRPARSLAFDLVSLLLVSLIPAVLGGVSTQTSESGRFLHLPAVFFCCLTAIILVRTMRSIPLGMAVLLFWTMEYAALHLSQSNWITASKMTENILDRSPDKDFEGMTYVIGLPGEYEGAFIFRNGFSDALSLVKKDPERIIPASIHSRDVLLHAPDTLVPLISDEEILLWPDVKVHIAKNGAALSIDDRAPIPLLRSDRIMYWDRHALEELWPRTLDPH